MESRSRYQIKQRLRPDFSADFMLGVSLRYPANPRKPVEPMVRAQHSARRASFRTRKDVTTVKRHLNRRAAEMELHRLQPQLESAIHTPTWGSQKEVPQSVQAGVLRDHLDCRRHRKSDHTHGGLHTQSLPTDLNVSHERSAQPLWSGHG